MNRNEMAYLCESEANEFEVCCLCEQSIHDAELSEFEKDVIELEGTCVHCLTIANAEMEKLREELVVSHT